MQRDEAISCVQSHLAAVIAIRLNEIRESEPVKTLGLTDPNYHSIDAAAKAAVEALIAVNRR